MRSPLEWKAVFENGPYAIERALLLADARALADSLRRAGANVMLDECPDGPDDEPSTSRR